MFSTFIRKVLSLDLEEKILNSMVILAMAGVIFPWMGGKLSLIDDQSVTYSGFGFYTSIIGFAVFALLGFTLLSTAVPLITGQQLLRKSRKNITRLICTSLSTVLVLSALSVLIQVTFTSPGMEVRFGIYVSLICSMVASLYSFLSVQEGKKSEVQELFHQTVDSMQQFNSPPRKESTYQKPSEPHSIPTPPEPELHGQLRR